MAENGTKFVHAPRLVCVELNPGPGRGENLGDEEMENCHLQERF